MSIPVLHTIRTFIDHSQPADSDIYAKPSGQPPKYHVVCSCQWEGWAHAKPQAEYFVASHVRSQQLRGNYTEIIPAPVASVSDEPPAPALDTAQDTKPSSADAPPAKIELLTSALVGFKA